MTLILEIKMEKETAMTRFLSEGDTIWLFGQKAVIKSIKKKEEKKSCNKCPFYGECDHQGAYKKDGKWCYDEEN